MYYYNYYFLILDFKKLHEAHFSKMESIDSYIQRKTKQIDNYRSAVKELKVPVLKFKMDKLKSVVFSQVTCIESFPISESCRQN